PCAFSVSVAVRCTLDPSSPSPCPYTTLFRALLQSGDRRGRWIADAAAAGDALGRHRAALHAYPRDPDALPGRRGAQIAWSAVRGDRKSTRLNSSHVKISYAVFCLKQKVIWLL